MRKIFATVVVLLMFFYVIDAMYPTWDWECSSFAGGAGMTIDATSVIPELGPNGDARAMHVNPPTGCSVRANNSMRRIFDWWVH